METVVKESVSECPPIESLQGSKAVWLKYQHILKERLRIIEIISKLDQDSCQLSPEIKSFLQSEHGTALKDHIIRQIG